MKHISLKLLSLLLLVSMVCSLLSGFAMGAEPGETSLNTEAQAATVQGRRDTSDSSTGTDSTTQSYPYILVNSAQRLTPGEYLILASVTGPYAGDYGFYALTTTEDDTYAMMQGVGQTFTELPGTINVDPSIYEQFTWKLQGNADSLTLQTSAGTYLTATANSSALGLSAQGSAWKGTYDADSYSFLLEAYGRNLALRSDVTVICGNGGSGFATSVPNTADPNLYLYKRINPDELKSVTLHHSLNLANDITLNYLLSKEQFQSFEDLWIDVERPIYEGNTLVDQETIRLYPVENGDYYYFTLEAITAVQINDTLQAVVHGYKDGIEYLTEPDVYSIATYAYRQMEKTDASPALRKLCAELLRYGSKSQLYKGYRTDALADASMTEEQAAYLTALEEVPFGSCKRDLDDLADPTVTWAGISLDLQSKVCVRFILNLSQYEGAPKDLSVRVKYVDLNGNEVEYTVEDCEAYRAAEGFYAFNFTELKSAELRTVLSAAAYCGDTQVSPTRQYSVDTYGNGKKGALLTTCQALFAYADAAYDYFVN